MEAPDLKHMSTADLVALMGECSKSKDWTDLEFAGFCREEIKRRKPPSSLGDKAP